ncbi:MAG: hypothetical protein K8F30_07870, partial [Taibaiella sp.]|nr:hypothetical protein [Taibaiella sp.]
LILSFSFVCCNKKETQSNQTNFAVNGVADLKVKANQSGTLALSIAHVSGNQETVTLSLSGLPPLTTHEFSTSSGIPTFASTLTITGDYAANGTYPLVLTAKSSSGVSKPYNFNLIVDDADDCAAKMAGSYAGSQTCGSSPYTLSMVVTKDPNNNKGGIIITGLYGGQLPAILNCSKNTIEIPETTVAYGIFTRQLSGSGTFVAPGGISFSLHEKLYVDGNLQRTDDCSYTFVK